MLEAHMLLLKAPGELCLFRAKHLSSGCIWCVGGWVGGSVIDSKAALVVPACYSVIISLTKHNFLTTHTTNGHNLLRGWQKNKVRYKLLFHRNLFASSKNYYCWFDRDQMLNISKVSCIVIAISTALRQHLEYQICCQPTFSYMQPDFTTFQPELELSVKKIGLASWTSSITKVARTIAL